MKFLILILLFISKLAVASPLNCALAKVKIDTVKNYKLTPEAEFEDISEAYTAIKLFRDKKFNIEVDARRLINQEDWKNALRIEKDKELIVAPWLYYGKKTMSDWEKGAKFINNLPIETKATPQLLKELHLMTADNLAFHGFEGRRIKEMYDQGLISHDQFKQLLHKAYKENVPVHDISHKDLRGVYRSSDFDKIVHKGSSFDDKGARYFNQVEKDAMINNKYIKATEADFKMVGPDKYVGEVYYLDPDKVEGAVSEILKRTEKLLAKDPPVDEVVKIVERMKIDLISVHPFLDGNGRTVRLLEDFLLRRHGLPPALHPNEMDLVMSIDEAQEFMRENMIKYVNEHIDDYIKVQQMRFAK